MRPTVTICLWVPGLCGGPDAPGDARGTPPPVRLTFRTARQQPWDAVLRGNTLYIALPPQMLPEGSREALIALLEAAEEKLNCKHVIVVSGEKKNLEEKFFRIKIGTFKKTQKSDFYCQNLQFQ